MLASYAARIDLAASRPAGDLASTGYCLAVPGREYLVYLPEGGTATMDLSDVKGRTLGGVDAPDYRQADPRRGRGGRGETHAQGTLRRRGRALPVCHALRGPGPPTRCRGKRVINGDEEGQ